MFGYISLQKVQHLVLIEEASLVGQVIRGNVFRVDKLMFVPLSKNSSLFSPPEDQAYIEMINRVVMEKSCYFSYDIDLTLNM